MARLLTPNPRVCSLFLALVLIALSSPGCLSGYERIPNPNTDVGRVQFETHCAACHQSDGSGAEGGGPPLVDSSWVEGPESRLIRIVLQGMRGPIEVGSETYNREMLGFGQVIGDDQIASLLTYVRARWGNVDRPVKSENVSQIRRDTEDRISYWNVDELLQIP